MDGYIKSKTEAIKAVKKAIIGKYSVTIFIILLLFVWLFALAANQAPERWTDTEIVFSHISQERIGLQRWKSYVLNTQEGNKFLIKSKYVDVDELSAHLVSGRTYQLVFSCTLSGKKHVEALSDGSIVFQDLENSTALWENEQRGVVTAIIITLIVELAALILIDKLWCRAEHAQIRKLKSDINRRNNRINK